MEGLDILHAFRDIAEISPSVHTYLQDENFKWDYPDYGDYDQKDLLATCYELMLIDLQSYGIYTLLPEEIAQDFYVAKHFYYLLYTLLPENITRRLIQRQNILQELEAIVTNEDNQQDGLIHQDIIDLLFKEDTDDPIYEYLIYIESEYTVQPQFCQYLANVIKYLREGSELYNLPDTDQAARYITKIQGLRQAAQQATYKIINALPVSTNINNQKIKKLLDTYDLDKLSADELRVYALVDLDELPASLQTYKKIKMDAHHARAPHHIEYWIEHNQEQASIENLILVAAHHAEPGVQEEEYWKEMNETIELAKKNNTFTEDQINFLLTCGEILFPQGDK